MSSIFLSKASPYGRAVEPVEIIQTHVSLVILPRDCACKLKRDEISMPRLFYRGAGQVACQAELALNR